MVRDNVRRTLENLDLKVITDLLKFATIRIDLKNFGLNNDIKLFDDSPDISYKNYPDWFCDEKGKGLILHSYKGAINLKFKCINDGSLRIAIRGIHFLDKNSVKVPIYINLNKFSLNGKEIVQNKLVWHDEPYILFKDVEDSEIINIELEWMPMNKNSIFGNHFKSDYEKLNESNTKYKNEILKLKKDYADLMKKNTKLSNELNDFKEKNFNLMVNLEKIAKENYILRKEIDGLESSRKFPLHFNRK